MMADRPTLMEFDPPDDRGGPENGGWISGHQLREMAKRLGLRATYVLEMLVPTDDTGERYP